MNHPVQSDQFILGSLKFTHKYTKLLFHTFILLELLSNFETETLYIGLKNETDSENFVFGIRNRD